MTLSVLATIPSIIADARRNGVHLEIIDEPTFIYLLMIRRDGGPKGSGRRVLLDLCEYADRHRRLISLLCENQRLADYYAQVGFELSPLQVPSLGFGMMRWPRFQQST